MKANALLQQLQETIDEAAEGSLVELPKGRLEGTLVVAKSLKLKGHGPDETILDGLQQQAALVVEASQGTVSLEGVLITGGTSAEGGGIQIFNGALLQLSHSRIAHNDAEDGIGGAVCIAEGRLEATECTWHHNAAVRGGAVFCGGVSEASFTQCEFTENQASNGGAIALAEGAKSELVRCAFQKNQATEQGAHIHLHGSSSKTPTLSIKSCEFQYLDSGNDFYNNAETPAQVSLENTLMPAHLQRILCK